MIQQVGPYQIDALTREEAASALKESLGHELSAQTREMYRGVKGLKLPVMIANASGVSVALPAANTPDQCGPQQGFIWRILRLTVTSSGADAGAVSLFLGGDPGNFSTQFLVDNTLKVGQAYYPGNKGLYLFPGEFLYVSAVSVANNTYRLNGFAVEVPAEMQGKLLAGG